MIFDVLNRLEKVRTMEQQENLYQHEIELGFFPKKDCLAEAKEIGIDKIHKSEYGFIAEIWGGFCGNRQLYINKQQYAYLKNHNATKAWVWANINHESSTKKKTQYSIRLSVDKVDWV